MIKIEHGEKHSNEGHLTLTHIPSSTQITINIWSKFYYFLVRSSELLLNNSNGYLITGCPQSEIIDRQAIIARLKQRFAQSQRQILVIPSRQRRQISLNEKDIPNECEKICSIDENDFIDECLFDCLAIGLVNATQALHVNEMHTKISRERRQLIENDKHVVKEFTDCYKKDVICQTKPYTDTGLTKQTSILMMIIILWITFLLK